MITNLLKGKENQLQVIKKYLLAAVLVFLVCTPKIISSLYVLHIFISCFIYIALTLSLNLIIGWSGQFSLGHVCFFGMGAYITTLLMMNTGMSFWFALLISAVCTGVLGALLCIPTLKLRGDYLAVVTLGFGEVFRLVMTNWTSVTRGPMGLPGIPSPSLFGISLHSRVQFYYMGLIVMLLVVFFMVRLNNSGFGLSMLAMNDDDIAASSIGIYPVKFKLWAFVIGAVIAAFVGSFYAIYIGFISPSSFTYQGSITMCAMVVLGGMASIPGSVFGAVILTVLPEALRAFSDYRMVLYGATMVLMMLFKPMGIWGIDKRIRNEYKLKTKGGRKWKQS
ncbi:MAG: branched-chain amino acid ABC transporter permease [Treponema sp.]|nr:branched-chain amino acid ABC transporter permease [Treponema sp.]